MQRITHLPRHYAKIACDKLYIEGYGDIKTSEIYNSIKLHPNSIKRKIILSVLYGMRVNEYQRKHRIGQRVVKSNN